MPSAMTPRVSTSHSRRVALASCVLALAAALCGASAAELATETSSPGHSTDAELDAQPRQEHFKISVVPNLASSSAAAAASSLSRRLKLVAHGKRSQVTPSDPASHNDTSPTSGDHSAAPRSHAITNGTLKKLLTQSSGLKSALGNHSKGPSFKFLSIQRATAASSPAAAADSKRSSSGSTSASATGQEGQSLASSVSKQLASSLLSSAASIVANMSSSPSLSSLASQIVVSSQKLFAASAAEHADNVLAAISKKPDAEVQPPATASSTPAESPIESQANTVSADRRATQPASTKTKLRRPSKIYNLPVKFVSNGQPNHVVFSAIKQHFAAIKKIQSTGVGRHKKRPLTSIGGGASGSGAGSSKTGRPKGSSRIIYLPLQYLSNARPSRVISVTRASHKASS